MILSRRSLLASLGLALPASVAATSARADAVYRPVHHHTKRHGHVASSHKLHPHKTHRTASAVRTRPQA
jgi:hypothetical protein